MPDTVETCVVAVPLDRSDWSGGSFDPSAFALAIPAGTWISGTWEIEATWDVIGGTINGSIGTPTFADIGSHNADGSFTDTASASAGQMAEINAAAGSALLGSFRTEGALGAGNITVTSLCLTLVGTQDSGGGGGGGGSSGGGTGGYEDDDIRIVVEELPHPHTSQISQFVTLTYLDGYIPGVALLGVGGLHRETFWQARADGAAQIVVSDGIVRAYADGVELAEGSEAITTVQIWRFGY